MTRLLFTAAAAALIAAPAFAQDAAQISTDQNDEYGTYLTDGDGRPVYLFTTDTQGTDDQQAAISCTSEECLEAWPLFTTEGEPTAASDEVQQDLIGTTDYEGDTVVTYNGWPLYYFVRDEGADAPQGNDIESFGGEWYLVTPEGEKVGH